MFEVMTFFGLLAVAALFVAGLALVALFVKLVFKVVLLPFTLIGGLFKIGFGLVGVLAALVLAPLALVLLLAVGLPVLLLCGLCVLGCGAVCAVAT